MSTLSLPHRAHAQLRREARTQRSALISLPLAILALVAGTVVMTRRGMVSDEIGIQIALLCSYACALLILGSECVAGELARGTLSSVERTPGGLKAAFTSKLCLYLSGVVAACLLGPFAYALAEGHSLEPASRMVRHLLTLGTFLVLVVPALGLSLWVFAASAWSPSGVLALPTALLLTLALVAAFWFAPHPFRPHAMRIDNGLFFVPAYVVGGYLAARFSFVQGLAGSASKGRAAMVGLRASSLVLLPAFLLVALRPDMTSIEMGRSSLHAGNAVLDSQSSRLRLIATHDSGITPLIIERIPALEIFREALLRRGQSTPHLVTVDLKAGKWTSINYWRTPEQKEAYEDYRHTRESKESPPELSAHGYFPGGPEIAWHGLGCEFFGKEVKIWDPIRDLVIPYREVADLKVLERVIVRRTDWLVRRHKENGKGFNWLRFDPLENTWDQALGLSGNILTSLVLADDRVISTTASGAFLVDPVTGDNQPLSLSSGEMVLNISSASTTPQAAESGPPVVFATTQAGLALALLHGDENRLTLLTSPSPTMRLAENGFLGRAQDGRIVAHLLDPTRIVLIEPDGSDLEQVFP